MKIMTIIVVAISLSMDAFSLSLAYGTLNLEKKPMVKLSLVVGIYHLIMPFLGFEIGNKIKNYIFIKQELIVFIIFFIIGLQMIIETFKEKKVTKKLKLKEMLLFGLAVSIDSLTVGIGLKTIYENIYLSLIIFLIVSSIFTYIGLNLGKKVSQIIGKISTLIGGIILMIIGLFYVI